MYRMPESIAALFGRLEVPVEGHVLGRGVFRHDGVVVELSHDEYVSGMLLAIHRMVESDLQGLGAKANAARTMEKDVQGILGEMAFCKAMGWDIEVLVRNQSRTIQEKRAGDIGKYEVRATTGLASPGGFSCRLIARENDEVGKVFVLVIGTGRVYEVAGWLYGSEIKSERYVSKGESGRPPCYMAPPESLHPIQTLPGVKNTASLYRHHVEDTRLMHACKPLGDPLPPELELLRTPKKTVEQLWEEARLVHGRG